MVCYSKFNYSGTTANVVVEKYQYGSWVTDTTISSPTLTNISNGYSVTGFNYGAYAYNTSTPKRVKLTISGLTGIRQNTQQTDVPTNINTSGVYASSSAGTATAYFGMPQVTIPPNYYTVTWKNDNGTVLETDAELLYGATPSYDGDDPTKEQSGNTVYTFTGWTPTIEPVTGNQVYTAVYSEQTVKNYTLTSRDITINLNADGTLKDFEGAGTIYGSVGYEGNGIYWAYPYYEFTLNGESQETKFIFESDNESVIDNDNDIDFWFSFTGNPGTTQLTLKAVGLVQGSTKVLATTTITVTVNKDEPEIVLTGIDTKNTVAYIMLGVPIFAAGVYFILSVRKKRITSV